MTSNFWLNALIIGDWFLLGVILILTVLLIWRLRKRGAKIAAFLYGVVIVCLLIGLYISALTTHPQGPQPQPVPSTTLSQK